MCDGCEGSNNFSTTFNTIGVGDVVPAGANGQLGSGDRFDQSFKNKKGKKKTGIATKAPAQNINWAKGIPTAMPYVVFSKNKK